MHEIKYSFDGGLTQEILEVYDDHIIIKAKGLYSKIKKDNIIYYKDITSIVLSKPLLGVHGSLSFVGKGVSSLIQSIGFGNTFSFKKLGNIEEIVDYINRRRIEINNQNNITANTEMEKYFDGGIGDILEIYNNYVIIKHTGFVNKMTQGFKGEKKIYFSDISSIEYKKATKWLNGFIQFGIFGSENKGGLLDATKDENSIMISFDNVEYAEQIYNLLNNKLNECKINKNNNNTVIQQAVSSADELKKFKELLDEGIITQEEFNAKKKQLLGL